MLEVLGVSSIDDLMFQTVPDSIRLPKEKMFKHKSYFINGINSESLVLKHVMALSRLNQVNKSYIG